VIPLARVVPPSSLFVCFLCVHGEDGSVCAYLKGEDGDAPAEKIVDIVISVVEDVSKIVEGLFVAILLEESSKDEDVFIAENNVSMFWTERYMSKETRV
jgi:hypothetical protein